MARYLTTHTVACASRRRARQVALSLAARSTDDVHFVRLLVNLADGPLFGEFEAPGPEQLLGWLERQNLPCDAIRRVDSELTGLQARQG